MTPTLNPHQQQELHRFIATHEEDEAVSAQFGERPEPVSRLAWFDCQVPGTVAVIGESGFVLQLLLPVPRPVPRDPMFQQPSPVQRIWQPFGAIAAAPAWRRDWQWEGMTMDAPSTMPAGACEYFALDDDVFGAEQMTCEREVPHG